MTKNKKYILSSILVLLSIILIIIFSINVNAESTTKEIENEKHLVKRATAVARGLDANGKVDKDVVEELLNKYGGSGSISVTEKSSDTLAITSSGREYEINIDSGPMISGTGSESISGSGGSSNPDSGEEIDPDPEPEPGDQLPSTAYTTPYLPTGFSPVTGTDLSTGLVIEDSLGNQYVWVEVPRTTTVYPNAGLSITAFTDTEYTSIETDLHTYTSVYRNGTGYRDWWYSEEEHGFVSANDYNTLKKKMLKSVYQNGGF